MNEIIIFQHEEFGKIGVYEVNGMPHFPATKIAEVLGYTKPHDAISRHCRYSVKHGVPHPQNPSKIIEMNFIPEGDLYRLIISSQLPSAERFERWVFDEVLPAIRKTGGYIPTDEGDTEMEILAKAVLISQKTIEHQKSRLEELQAECRKQEKVISELAPKAAYHDIILRNPGTVNINAIAKDYGMSAKEMNKLLHGLGIQYQQDGQWLLYAQYQDKGYTHSKTVEFERSNGYMDSRLHTQWTQAGRKFLYDKLKAKGILPLIERKTA